MEQSITTQQAVKAIGEVIDYRSVEASPDDLLPLAVLARDILEWIAQGSRDTRAEGFGIARLSSSSAVDHGSR